ncbi:MAG: hypothetical protein ACYTGW_07730, partial [Planctomycetota bacterium]
MSPQRPRTALIATVCLLTGLAAYSAWAVARNDGPDPDHQAPDHPGPGEMANGQQHPPDRAGSRPDTRAVAGKPEFDVVVRLTPFAKLLPPLPARPELRLWRGDTRVPA